MPSINSQEQEYKRGLVLGLTMAEIVLLLLFALLLAIGVELKSTEQENIQLDQKVVSLEKQLEQVLTDLGTKQYEEIRVELIKLRTLDEKVDYLLEIYQVNNSAELSQEDKIKIIEELLSSGKELTSILDSYGLPTDTAELNEFFEKIDSSSLADELASMKEELNRTQDEVIQKESQIANMRAKLDGLGKGTEMPACWADTITGRPKYVYEIALTVDGLIVRDFDIPPWSETRSVPVQSIPKQLQMTSNKFIAEAEEMFEWSRANSCRFFVKVFDVTGEGNKLAYKKHMRALESAFYKYEVVNGSW